jgi:hypothetical protein
MRSCAEIGSVDTIKLCREKGGDPNAEDGFPLYSSIYNGNYEVAKYLLSREGGANPDHFGFKQGVFCASIILMEIFSIFMLIIIILMWTIAMVQTFAGYQILPPDSEFLQMNGVGINSENIMTIEILSAVLLQSVLALVIMQRLVPFDKICHAFFMVCVYKWRRHVDQRERILNG